MRDDTDSELAVTAPPADLGAPELYLNRELTWLAFNGRVLEEARDARLPVLERVRFLAIAGTNLDEFFMKRIGGLKQQVGAGVHDLTVDGRTPERQLAECHQAVRAMQATMGAIYHALVAELALNGIGLVGYGDLDEGEREWLRSHYVTNVFPLVTPLAIDPAHPFPFISNLSVNLLVTVRGPARGQPVLARIKVPVGSGVPRFVRIRESLRFVALEDVIAANLDLLFPGMTVESGELFRVTRNANTELDEEVAGDLLAMIQTELRHRKFAPIVRLQLKDGMSPVHRGMLAAELGLNEATDVFEVGFMIGMRDLMEIASLDIPALHEPPHHPIDNIALKTDRNVFHVIRDAGSILLQHPFESFTTSVVRFVSEAARDPKVLAIKMTLYRTSDDTGIVDLLVEAARNGKQVAVVVELKARFDEAANIQWASRLENVGIHVNYGVVGLKTHLKAVLVVRKDYTGLRRYAHIGTGNYHAGTARQYVDFGLLTADDAIGHDLTELFNFLTTGLNPSRGFQKLMVAPRFLKTGLMERIEREIAHARAGREGLIRLKTNAIEDPDVTKALYRASQAGVRVEMIVRDTCRLRPGIPGVSDNIRVVSIVGRFLEHGRIHHFHNAGDDEYFIGSADLMRRNLESRVEILAPVEDPGLRAELAAVLDIQLNDRDSAWEMDADGRYLPLAGGTGERATDSHNALIERARERDRGRERAAPRRRPAGGPRLALRVP